MNAIGELSMSTNDKETVSNFQNLELDKCFHVYGCSSCGLARNTFQLLRSFKEKEWQEGQRNLIYNTFSSDCKTVLCPECREDLEVVDQVLTSRPELDELQQIAPSAFRKSFKEAVVNEVGA